MRFVVYREPDGFAWVSVISVVIMGEGMRDRPIFLSQNFCCFHKYFSVIKCSFIRDDGSTSQVETRFAPYRTAETYSWIR